MCGSRSRALLSCLRYARCALAWAMRVALFILLLSCLGHLLSKISLSGVLKVTYQSMYI